MSDLRRSGREPAINMPGWLLGFIALLLAVQAVRAVIPATLDLDILLGGAFIPARSSVAFDYAEPSEIVRAATSAGDPDLTDSREALAQYAISDRSGAAVWTLLTHALLHGSWVHVGLNAVWLAAFGTPVSRRLGPTRSTVLAVGSALGGAFGYWIGDPLSAQLLIGASGVVSGFMGAAALFVFRGPHDAIVRARLGDLFRNRNALIFLGFWLVFNLLTGLFGVPFVGEGGAIAWQAHLGGLLTGLLLFPLLDRPAGA